MSDGEGELLPLHGFVLAGGKSSRMGRDKATLAFEGRPLVEHALEKLRPFCANVSIVGNREDLRRFAPVAREDRLECGPGAGLEAGVAASTTPWAIFVPVDAPLVPRQLLRRWSAEVLQRDEGSLRLSFLRAGGQRQPTFCMLHKECLPGLAGALDEGERMLAVIFDRIVEGLSTGALWVPDAAAFAPEQGYRGLEPEGWFSNANTPEELQVLEAAVRRSPARG